MVKTRNRGQAPASRYLAAALACMAALLFAGSVPAQTAEGNRRAGEAFLEQNAKRAEVTVLPSGLQYEVLQPGKGASPGPRDRVTVHYRGTLTDGREFDSSYRRGQPATFPLDRVIPGWTEGLQLMSVGAHYRLYVPPSLAYGARQAGPMIAPYSTLIFDVELLDVRR